MVRKKAGRPAVAAGRARVRPHVVRSVRCDKAAGLQWPVMPTVPAPEPTLPVAGTARRAAGPGQRVRRWGTRQLAAPAAASDGTPCWTWSARMLFKNFEAEKIMDLRCTEWN